MTWFGIAVLLNVWGNSRQIFKAFPEALSFVFATKLNFDYRYYSNELKKLWKPLFFQGKKAIVRV